MIKKIKNIILVHNLVIPDCNVAKKDYMKWCGFNKDWKIEYIS